VPVLLGLPTQAAGTGPQGLGANYFSANNGSTNASMMFVKQAFARFNNIGRVEGQSLKFGRMELFDGTEVSPKNATLATIKRDRVAQRLLGNFAFTHVGRSLDGVEYTIDKPRVNFTFVGARPTRGVFQVDGWGELNVNVFYGAVTGRLRDASHPGACSDSHFAIIETVSSRPTIGRSRSARPIATTSTSTHSAGIMFVRSRRGEARSICSSGVPAKPARGATWRIAPARLRPKRVGSRTSSQRSHPGFGVDSIMVPATPIRPTRPTPPFFKSCLRLGCTRAFPFST